MADALTRLLIFLVSFMHVSNATSYVQALRTGFVQWHFWGAGIAMCLGVILLSGTFFKVQRNLVSYLLWCFAFILLCLSSLLLVNNDETSIESFIAFGWFFATSCSLSYVVARSPKLIRACGNGIVAAVVLLSGLTIMEFFDPNFQVLVDAYFDDKTKIGQINRSGSLYGNANDNGTAIVLGMFVGLFFLPKSLRLVFMLFAGVAVFGTVSRGSLTLWAVAVVLALIFGFGSKSRIAGFFGILIVGILSYFLVAGEIPNILASMGLDGLLSESMKVRLSENFFTQEDGSTLARIEVVGVAWNLFVTNPLTGIGLGVSDYIGPDSVGTHNQHLKIATELGIAGVFVYAALILIAFRYGSSFSLIFLLLYGIIGFTNHSMMTYTVYAVLIPAALVFVPEMQRISKARRTQGRRKVRRKRSVSVAESQLSA